MSDWRERTELLIGGVSLLLSTAGFLLGSYALIVIGLVSAALSFGVRIGRV